MPELCCLFLGEPTASISNTPAMLGAAAVAGDDSGKRRMPRTAGSAGAADALLLEIIEDTY